MLQVQRLAIVWGATIFFLVISPLLAIYALGYDFDLKQNDLKNTVTLSTETSPDNSLILANGDFGTIQNYSNGDFRVATTKQFSVDLIKESFLSEQFLVKGRDEDNSLVRLKKIHLLPQQSQALEQVDTSWKNISFVSKDYLVYSKINSENNINEWFLQQYSFNGFLGVSKKLEISTSPNNFEQNKSLEIEDLIQNSFWEEVERDTFWEKNSQTFIYKNEVGDWKIWQSQFLGLGNLDSIWLEQNQVLLHDNLKTKNLYIYNIVTDRLDYVTDNIRSISLNNGVFWVWHQEEIYKIEKNQILDLKNTLIEDKNSFNLRNFEEFEISTLYNLEAEIKVKNVYQGVVISINRQIFYLPDSQINSWKLIASNVKYWTTSWHSIFWVNDDSNIITHNLELGYRRIVSHLNINFEEVEVVNLDYYPLWHRVFVYYKIKGEPSSNLKVSSVWYNPDFINDQIRSFSFVDWLNEPVCRNFVDSGYIFCIDKDGKFLNYRNLS